MILYQLDAGNHQEWEQFIGTAKARSPAVMVVMPCTDVLQGNQAARLMAARSGVVDAMLVIMLDSAREGFIALANRAFRATNAPLFGYVAQDAFPGRDWLNRAVRALSPENRGLLGFNDGKWAGGLASFGLARRAWAEQNYPGGELFCPDYHSHFADVELTVLALAGRQYVYDPNAVMMEIDWGKDNKPANAQDRATYAARKATGFGKGVPLELQNYAA